ncbi:putative 60S ribosomal protein L24 [Gregarina niphandrodes]|uniref:60S ribosomal protein L24 n=1 Tax=Gregarina niphandrodes TaxID=110365 RepID=A0A023BD40_GRENI|nr:putative 60S ribosomal protein L24 [Gregarina niphandrodes]EZG87442.1 putative 60S ribosomal protein L24 [Gregarina niphandrodes]|eukprot:XP_011128647.1 putative 60S ribosomal protein L24 [Gregarina niphandrodes]
MFVGHGMKFVRNDGSEFVFCQSKCKRHFSARHSPRKSKWTKAHRKTAGKEMLYDSIFNFEKRRNAPVKYNREIYVKTIQAMTMIERIKRRREERFYLQRMRQAQDKHMTGVRKNLAKSDHLVNMLRIKEKRVKRTITDKTKAIVAQAVKDSQALKEAAMTN